MAAARDRHDERIRRVIAYVQRHLDEELDLDALSAVAAFSPCHFHRQFTAAVGMTPHRFVQLLRLKRAGQRLAFRGRNRVTAIALEAGYEAPDAFARAFRDRFGQSPTAFRAAPDWDRWCAALVPLDPSRSGYMPTRYTAADVVIRSVAPIPVAILTHRGDPARLGDTIRRFIAWRQAAGLSFRRTRTFNVFHDDPRHTPPDRYRLDLCVGVDRPVGRFGEPIETGIIPGGRCAVLRVSGDVEPAASFLYRDWLLESGEEPRGHPLFCERLSVFPDVPEHEATADLFLPLR